VLADHLLSPGSSWCSGAPPAEAPEVSVCFRQVGEYERAGRAARATGICCTSRRAAAGS